MEDLTLWKEKEKDRRNVKSDDELIHQFLYCVRTIHYPVFLKEEMALQLGAVRFVKTSATEEPPIV
jgi:hypothetical protein